MNLKQKQAAKQLKHALDMCHAHGLQGGVYSGNFCVWPSGGENPHEVQVSGANDFFGAVTRECSGAVILTRTPLDGGAGN